VGRVTPFLSFARGTLLSLSGGRSLQKKSYVEEKGKGPVWSLSPPVDRERKLLSSISRGGTFRAAESPGGGIGRLSVRTSGAAYE